MVYGSPYRSQNHEKGGEKCDHKERQINTLVYLCTVLKPTNRITKGIFFKLYTLRRVEKRKRNGENSHKILALEIRGMNGNKHSKTEKAETKACSEKNPEL